MGMYTRLQLDVEVYPDFVKEIEEYVENVPRLRCSSYYFHDRGENKIERDELARCLKNPTIEAKRENTEPMAILHVDISCKNYGMEIETFLTFLSGKVVNSGNPDAMEHVGSMRYENDIIPKLIFQHVNELQIKEVQIVS